MNYASDRIRSVLLAGHAGAGKTTLAEALLYAAGCIDRQGCVQQGNTVCDYEKEEIRRRASLSLSIAPVELDGVKINLLDAPGLFDFEAGLFEGLRAAESVCIVVSARSGLSAGADKAYREAVRQNKARMIYISKSDVENGDFYKVFEQLKAALGPSVCPIVVPVEQAGGRVYLNLITKKAYSYAADGTAREVPVPRYGHRTEGLMNAMREAVAETDDALMERFFEGEPFTEEEMTQGVRMGTRTGSITPVVCGAAPSLAAIDQTLWAMRRLLPSAARAAGELAEDCHGTAVDIECNQKAPLCACVFKTVTDPFMGKMSYVKVISGCLTVDTPLVNARTGESERAGKIAFARGRRLTDAKEVGAGDLCVLTKLPKAKTGDTLCEAARIVRLKEVRFPRPTMSMAVHLKEKGDETKLSGAMQRMTEEDATLRYYVNSETAEPILEGMGEQHLDVVCARLQQKFGTEIVLKKPRVAYRESIRGTYRAQGRHKKQTGGHGQFGDVWIEFSPTNEDDFIFEERVFGGSVPRSFFPAVEKGLQEAMRHGVLAGYPVVGVKATLLDGSYHPVDSSEMAFKQAARLAYKAALPKASPVLLEPVGALRVVVPSSSAGDMMGEITKRRGRVLGMNPDEEGMQVIEAEAPVQEMQDFTTCLRQAAQGRGRFHFAFVRYEQVPDYLAEKVIQNADNKAVNGIDDE